MKLNTWHRKSDRSWGQHGVGFAHILTWPRKGRESKSVTVFNVPNFKNIVSVFKALSIRRGYMEQVKNNGVNGALVSKLYTVPALQFIKCIYLKFFTEILCLWVCSQFCIYLQMWVNPPFVLLSCVYPPIKCECLNTLRSLTFSRWNCFMCLLSGLLLENVKYL